jgi:hypothetical protein
MNGLTVIEPPSSLDAGRHLAWPADAQPAPQLDLAVPNGTDHLSGTAAADPEALDPPQTAPSPVSNKRDLEQESDHSTSRGVKRPRSSSPDEEPDDFELPFGKMLAHLKEPRSSLKMDKFDPEKSSDPFSEIDGPEFREFRSHAIDPSEYYRLQYRPRERL